MGNGNPVMRLAATHSNLEIWWDSSPLIYENWLAGPGKPYAEHGVAPEDWVRHPAFVATANSFTQSMESVEAFAAKAISAA
jgi:hypothetical protein